MGNCQMLLRLPKDFHITLLGKEVTPFNSARDLCIEMDATLSFDEHITNTVSSCFTSLCQINRIKHLFDLKSLENLIHALVFSQLFYCSPVWSSTSKKNVSKMQSVQNFAARVVTGSRKFEHVTPVLRDLNWLPVSSMLKYTVGILTFKCVNGLAPRYLCSPFVTRATVHDRNTRNKNKLDIPGYKSAAGKWSFLYRSVTMWNSLPTAITDCNNLAMFMRKSKDYLFRLYLIFQIVNCIIIRWLLYIYKLGLNALLS